MMQVVLIVIIILIVYFLFKDRINSTLKDGYALVSSKINGDTEADGSAITDSGSDVSGGASAASSSTSNVASLITGEKNPDSKTQLGVANLLAGIQASQNGTEACGMYSTLPYGVPDIDFKEWTTMASVDSKTMNSHAAWVSERLAGNESATTSFTASEFDTYDAVPWQGLSRPAAVAINNPDQIADIDTSLNPTRKRFTWISDSFQ